MRDTNTRKSARKTHDQERDLRKVLIETIDQPVWSDRHLSKLATGSSDTIRNIRRGASPRLDTFEAILWSMGYTCRLVPCGGRRKLPNENVAKSTTNTAANRGRNG